MKAHHALWTDAVGRGFPEDGILLAVDVSRQRMGLLQRGQRVREYVVSTSKKGTGNLIDSFKTPTGWHVVVERYGDGQPPGRVFFEREPTAEVLSEDQWSSDVARDLIMTRILRLAGLEPGHNLGGQVDTYERYIYVHAANHEHLLGTPVSHGCIHVGNREIIELFERVKNTTTWCWIG